MGAQLGLALCLMAILEGIVLFAFPASWQRLMAELANGSPQRVRLLGGIAMILGLIGLQFLHR